MTFLESIPVIKKNEKIDSVVGAGEFREYFMLYILLGKNQLET